MKKVILATTSPYRKEAFKFLGIDFEVQGSNVDESLVERNNAEDLVKCLSRLKAEAVAKDYPAAIIIGMDSIVYYNGKIFEKPKSKEEAFKRLKDFSKNSFQFYTGIYMIDKPSNKTNSRVEITKVFMREISEEEINKYLGEDDNYNTYCLGYDPLGHYSATFARRIEGSYNNLLRGIPLEVVIEMLEEIGYFSNNKL